MSTDFTEVRKRFLDFSDGDEGSLRELIGRFSRTMEENVGDLDRALRSRDARDISRQAHRGVGPSDMFGLSSLSTLFRSMEESADRGDVEEAEAGFAKVREEFDRIRAGLADNG